MYVFLALFIDLLRLPFRVLGWLLLRLSGQHRGDMDKLNGVVKTLDKDPTVTRMRGRRNR